MYNFIHNKDTKQYSKEPIELPNEVKFTNLIPPNKDYVEIGMTCELKNANEPIFPKNCSFYLTNNIKDNLFHKVYVRNKCLTTIELVYVIFDWIIYKNIYYNGKRARSKKKDIIHKEIWQYAEYLAVHGIKKTDENRRNIPIYNIKVSS